MLKCAFSPFILDSANLPMVTWNVMADRID